MTSFRAYIACGLEYYFNKLHIYQSCLIAYEVMSQTEDRDLLIIGGWQSVTGIPLLARVKHYGYVQYDVFVMSGYGILFYHHLGANMVGLAISIRILKVRLGYRAATPADVTGWSGSKILFSHWETTMVTLVHIVKWFRVKKLLLVFWCNLRWHTGSYRLRIGV